MWLAGRAQRIPVVSNFGWPNQRLITEDMSRTFENANADPDNGQRASYYSLVALWRRFSYAS
jgi:hypothetical protein